MRFSFISGQGQRENCRPTVGFYFIVVSIVNTDSDLHCDRPVSIPAGQADGIHPRTIEVFQVARTFILLKFCSLHIYFAQLQSYGIGERLLKEGNHLHMFVRPTPILYPSRIIG